MSLRYGGPGHGHGVASTAAGSTVDRQPQHTTPMDRHWRAMHRAVTRQIDQDSTRKRRASKPVHQSQQVFELFTFITDRSGQV